MPTKGPLIPRRRLGAALRELREAVEMHLDAAASHLECSTATISRLETGQGIPKARNIRDLLDLHGVEDQRARDRLLRLAGDGRRQGWWENTSRNVPPTIETYISLEWEANSLSHFTGFAIHDLAQAKEYVRKICTSIFNQAKPDEIEKLVDIRIDRQKKLAEREESLSIAMVLDEGALCREVGGRQVMCAQLQRLIEFWQLPEVRLRILPFSLGNQLGGQCRYGIFQFDEDMDRNTVNIELSGGDSWLEQEAEVDKYLSLFNRIFPECLDESQSHDLSADY
jgi:transcriptional regulator with XRE-family HTH domain